MDVNLARQAKVHVQARRIIALYVQQALEPELSELSCRLSSKTPYANFFSPSPLVRSEEKVITLHSNALASDGWRRESKTLVQARRTIVLSLRRAPERELSELRPRRSGRTRGRRGYQRPPQVLKLLLRARTLRPMPQRSVASAGGAFAGFAAQPAGRACGC